VKTDEHHIIKLLKYFNIGVPRVNGVNLDFSAIKQSEFLHYTNKLVLVKLYKDLNAENGGN
jgi:hypothetical protein